MDTFIAQLNQLLMSTHEDSWLVGLFDLIVSHTGAWVSLTAINGTVIAESLPLSGERPKDPPHYIQRPIIANESHLGHLTISSNSPFTILEEQMLEISRAICVVQLCHHEKQAHSQHRQQANQVREAINALSFSELEAAIYISQALGGLDGLLIAGHVADKLGFTRSIVVTALKKLEAAGLIETRSLGVKGTYIKINEPMLVEELGKLAVDKKL